MEVLQVYTQEIVCPKCGKMTSVNVPDSGCAITPCSRWFCEAKIKVVVDDHGRVTTVEEDRKCIIATACFEAVGQGEDCRELAVLRGFRDCYLRDRPEGPRLIAEYYAIAPMLVQQIDSDPDRAIIWREIFHHVRHAVDLVELGEQDQAIACYKDIVKSLKARFYTSGVERSGGTKPF